MTLELLAAKLSTIAERLQMVRKHRRSDADAYREEPEARDLVAFNLMLAVQSAADLAVHIVGDEGLLPARSVGEAFERIAEAGIIEPSLAARLRRAVGFRNVVAHGYTALNLETLSTAANDGVADLEQYAQQVAAWADRRPS